MLLAALAAVVAAAVAAASAAPAPAAKWPPKYDALLVETCHTQFTDAGCRCVVPYIEESVPFADLASLSKTFLARISKKAMGACGGAAIETRDETYAPHLPGAADFTGRASGTRGFRSRRTTSAS